MIIIIIFIVKLFIIFLMQ